MDALFWLALGLAGAEWIAVWRRWKKVTYVTKPGMMVALIAWYVSVTPFLNEKMWASPPVWFCFGLIASLVGDVLLMLPGRFFLPGLVAFLCAHIFYLVGFNIRPPEATLMLLVPALLVAITAAVVFRSIIKGMNRSQGSRKMRVLVVIYAFVISLMLYSALISPWRPGWHGRGWESEIVSLGALLFWCSDAVLATGKFVRPLKWGNLAVMVLYQLGQIALAIGVSLAFGPIA